MTVACWKEKVEWLVVEQSLRSKILSHFHNWPIGGHSGTDEFSYKISKEHWIFQ